MTTATTIRDRKSIPRFADVSDADWADYKWQLRNRLTTTEDFDQVAQPDRPAARRPARPAWASSASA